MAGVQPNLTNHKLWPDSRELIRRTRVDEMRSKACIGQWISLHDGGVGRSDDGERTRLPDIPTRMPTEQRG
jgi:hypothetical protein